MEFRKLISNILKLCVQTLNSSLKITVVLGSLLDYFLEYRGKHKNMFVFHICLGLLLWLHRTIICVGRVCVHNPIRLYCLYFLITIYQLFLWICLALESKLCCWAASCNSQTHYMWLNGQSLLNWSVCEGNWHYSVRAACSTYCPWIPPGQICDDREQLNKHSFML